MTNIQNHFETTKSHIYTKSRSNDATADISNQYITYSIVVYCII